MSGPISFDTAPIVNNAVTYVQPPFKDLTKLAIVGWDNELDNLLKALPGQPVCTLLTYSCGLPNLIPF